MQQKMSMNEKSYKFDKQWCYQSYNDDYFLFELIQQILQSLDFEMNKRQLELQNIIKSLQSKIHALKRQNSACKQQTEKRIEEAINKEQSIVQQKEKTIVFLKGEVDKIRKQTQRQIKLASAHYQQEQQKSTKDLLKYKNQCETMQAQISRTNQYHQKKLKEKQNQISKMVYKCQSLERQKRALLQQRQNFNKFYLSAIHKLPQRQETLLWVDKLIDFMSKTQSIFTNQQKQKDANINKIIKCIEDEFTQISSQFKKTDAAALTEKQKFIEQLEILINQAQRDYDQAIRTNKQFWDIFSKCKAKEQVQQLARVEAQLNECYVNHKKQVQALQEGLQASQKEKKVLLLNFQQMKSLYEIRDKTSKQQIQLLKESIAQLLQSQQIREKEFQEQIQRLGEKIQHVTSKFYEKLQLPIQQMSVKIKSQIQCFKSQFQGFYSDTLLQKQLQNFENHIVEYLVSLNNSKQQRSYLRQTAQGSLKIIQMIKSIETIPPTPQRSFQVEPDKQKMTYSTVSYTYQSNDKEFKDKENKLNYELATVKKQLEKLKEHCKQLEGKSKIKQSMQAASRIIELTAENELLKDRIQQLSQGVFSQSKVAQTKLARINSSLLEKLVQNSELLLKFTEKQQDFIDKMSKCISSLNTFIINPVQMFEKLSYEIDHITIQPGRELPVVREALNENHCIFEAKKQAFSLLLSKKNQNQLFLQKTSNELSKHIRQLLAKCNAGAKTYRSSGQQQKLEVQKIKPSQSRHLMQKRIKQVQTQRIKNREQMLGRLKILDDKFKSVQQKYIKKQGFSFNKAEQSITKRIQDMLASYNTKQKLKDLGKITQQAFNDIQSKLKECIIQNQGLVKESQLLRSYKQ